MGLATSSVVAARGAINESGQLGTLEVMGKLAAAAIRRNSNFSAVTPNLIQKTAHAFQRPSMISSDLPVPLLVEGER